MSKEGSGEEYESEGFGDAKGFDDDSDDEFDKRQGFDFGQEQLSSPREARVLNQAEKDAVAQIFNIPATEAQNLYNYAHSLFSSENINALIALHGIGEDPDQEKLNNLILRDLDFSALNVSGRFTNALSEMKANKSTWAVLKEEKNKIQLELMREPKISNFVTNIRTQAKAKIEQENIKVSQNVGALVKLISENDKDEKLKELKDSINKDLEKLKTVGGSNLNEREQILRSIFKTSEKIYDTVEIPKRSLYVPTLDSLQRNIGQMLPQTFQTPMQLINYMENKAKANGQDVVKLAQEKPARFFNEVLKGLDRAAHEDKLFNTGEIFKRTKELLQKEPFYNEQDVKKAAVLFDDIEKMLTEDPDFKAYIEEKAKTMDPGELKAYRQQLIESLRLKIMSNAGRELLESAKQNNDARTQAAVTISGKFFQKINSIYPGENKDTIYQKMLTLQERKDRVNYFLQEKKSEYVEKIYNERLKPSLESTPPEEIKKTIKEIEEKYLLSSKDLVQHAMDNGLKEDLKKLNTVPEVKAVIKDLSKTDSPPKSPRLQNILGGVLSRSPSPTEEKTDSPPKSPRSTSPEGTDSKRLLFDPLALLGTLRRKTPPPNPDLQAAPHEVPPEPQGVSAKAAKTLGINDQATSRPLEKNQRVDTGGLQFAGKSSEQQPKTESPGTPPEVSPGHSPRKFVQTDQTPESPRIRKIDLTKRGAGVFSPIAEVQTQPQLTTPAPGSPDKMRSDRQETTSPEDLQEQRRKKALDSKPPDRAPPVYTPSNPLAIKSSFNNHVKQELSFGQEWSNYILNLETKGLSWKEQIRINELKNIVNGMDDNQKSDETGFISKFQSPGGKLSEVWRSDAKKVFEILDAIREGKTPTQMLQRQKEPESPRNPRAGP